MITEPEIELKYYEKMTENEFLSLQIKTNDTPSKTINIIMVLKYNLVQSSEVNAQDN
jgi:hypothetical protein